ncbi:MAG: LysE family translocator [Epsilonproteobacteria bacterium]|nr:MAG: LysE family translocator [Campylobacterota bacterium]
MTLLSAMALTGAMFLLAVSPGPGLFAVISRALANGFYHASVVVAGLILGDIIYLLMAIYGLNAVASMMGEFFIIIKYIGGIYLLYLGYKIWVSEVKDVKVDAVDEISWSSNFFSGLLITLGNPKVIIFYLGFLPAFMNLEILSSLDVLFTVMIVSTVLAVVILTYAYLASKSRKFFTTKSSINKLNKISGGVMIGAGSLLVLKS